MYEMYEDDTTEVEGGFVDKSEENEIPLMATILERQVSTPEVNYIYVNSSAVFPRGNTYSREKVIGQKIDASGNIFGRSNDNPVLYMCEYRVKFYYGGVSKLTENVISDFVYSACYYSSNDYLIMESIVD